MRVEKLKMSLHFQIYSENKNLSINRNQIALLNCADVNPTRYTYIAAPRNTNCGRSPKQSHGAR